MLFALYMAGQTKRIHLGSAVITNALHHPLRLAEDLLTADVLTGGRLSIGLGSGSTASEFAAFGIPPEDRDAEPRHQRFAEGLEVLEQAWRGDPISVHGRYVDVEAPPVLPRAIRPLTDLLWIAANSEEQGHVAGQRGYGIMLSRERTVVTMGSICEAYRTGRREARLSLDGGRIAASRPMYVAPTDGQARAEAEEAIWTMVHRQRRDRPQFATMPVPTTFDEACERVQFIAGSPQTVAQEVRQLYAQVPFTALHIQPRWKGLPPLLVQSSIRRFQQEVYPLAF